MAWIRPSRNDCSSRAAWYSAFSLRSPCSLRRGGSGRMTSGRVDLGQLVELGLAAERGPPAVSCDRIVLARRGGEPCRCRGRRRGDRCRRLGRGAGAAADAWPRRRRLTVGVAVRRHRSGSATTGVRRGGRLDGSASNEPVSPVARRSPVGRRRFAKGRTTGVRQARRSAAGTPSANAASSASSYSSVAAVAAHQTRARSSERRIWSQCPPRARPPVAERRRAPIAATRRATEVSVAPM